MSDNIKVVVKVRPLISRELENKLPCQWRVQSNTLYQLDSNGRDIGQNFTFDKVYSETTETTDVYNDVAKPIVEAATAGFNGTIFAYGQTSSGKTYIMTGTSASPGVIPLAVYNLFENIKNIPDRDFLVRVSYIEIYNETVKDLLDVKKANIKIHETYEGSIKVDVMEKLTTSPEEVLEAMREGEANKQMGATNMNEKSSRSHTIFQITIESREHIDGTEQAGCVNVSQLNLVDLAGSERAGQTGATGKRFKEGTHINKSLSALALVIKQLSDDPNKHANYRDSKLTRILQNSLGGNAKTSIICAVTPAALEETISTLQFATRAKVIKNKPEVNAVATDATMIQGLTKKLCLLQSELESKKNLEVMLESTKNNEQDLQKRIANLKKLILNGFDQRRSMDVIGGTRKKQQPRRQTISTLHSIDEVTVPTVPRFCTPSIKYNPMVIPKPSDFVPIKSTKILVTLPEEPAPMITPPPKDKRVNFNDDVVEIDSDDDEEDSSSLPTCSPYHHCFSESKTPPCILRKNLNMAEKNYQEIIELTERERMYKPDIVELMEKLEQTTIMNAKLQNEVEILKNSKDKDLEVDHLKCKINKAEEEIKSAKLKLETVSKNYDTKLTDWEVSYETLMKKAKLRENELLSLLEEQKQKKCVEIGKLLPEVMQKESMAFMDISKDISLVNSDNESSVVTSNEEEEPIQDIVANLQDQLIAKCQNIVQLEADIASQKQSIEFLEQSSHELQGLVNSYKEKLSYFENENNMLQSTKDKLNATIESQKENLEKAQSDMFSYNSVIQELQIKLTKKDNLLNINISDSVLETMIANEEKVIANNDNMKNIIYSFKIALDKRNKEIERLKLTIQEKDTSNNALVEENNNKTKQIELLSEEISKLNNQINDNVATIAKLTREKSKLISIEHDLTEKLTNIDNQKIQLENLDKEKTSLIGDLRDKNENLLQSLSNSNAKELEYVQLNNELQTKLNESSKKVIEIEEEIKVKDKVIFTLNKQINDKEEYEHQAKSAMGKLKRVMSILSGDVREIPDIIGNFVTLVHALSSGLNTLEDIASDTISEKTVALNENSQLKIKISELQRKYDVETAALQIESENLKKTLDNIFIDNTNLKEINTKLTNAISDHQKEIDAKYDTCKTLEAKCKSFKDVEDSLRCELFHAQEVLSSFKEKEVEYNTKIEDLQVKLRNIVTTFNSEHDQLLVKEGIITKALNTIEELKTELKHKSDSTQETDQLVANIFRKLCDITIKLKIETNTSHENVNGNCYEHTLQILDDIISYTLEINSLYVNGKENMEYQVCEYKKKMGSLCDQNQELKLKLSLLENENKALLSERESNNVDRKSLSENLIESNTLLEHLQVELKCKAAEIKNMESKVKEWSERFINLDLLMKQQMEELQLENHNLKVRLSTRSLDTWPCETSYIISEEKPATAFMAEARHQKDTVCPQSLVTICCNTIVENMESKHNDYNSVTPSSSDCEIKKAENGCSVCVQLLLDISILQQENSSLAADLEQLEIANKELIIEHEKIREEVILLLDPAEELQKKIASHKTNLSILTATTYAENRSLESKVKGLQHHHSRFHNVCQRDIPEFKKQLHELLIILKGDSSVSDIQNANLKRYSLPAVLDNNTTASNYKNESTLDEDLLMLDTNATFTTAGDNTVVGYDQTCLDLTQTIYNDVYWQTNDINQTEPNAIQSNVSLLEQDSQNISHSLKILYEENCKLKALLEKCSRSNECKINAQSSLAIEPSTTDDGLHTRYRSDNGIPVKEEILEEVKCLTQKLADIQVEKNDIEMKYNNLVLEMPNTDALVKKLMALETEYIIKGNEVTKLTSSLNNKNKELKILQEENDSLSTQIMENISEADDLNRELDRIKGENIDLCNQLFQLEYKETCLKSETNVFECTQCQKPKNESIQLVKIKTSPHAKLSRSLSDSDTTSRYNKICTLQSELYAGREDCKALTEDVATIKQHLNSSNMSVDLDESMGDSNTSQPKHFVATSPQNTKCNMPDIQEELPLDLYKADKIDCLKYYLEMTGVEKGVIPNDVKIIDILNMLYNNLVAKHGNEIQNLSNKLKDCEESRITLQSQIDDLFSKYETMEKAMADKEKNLNSVSEFISELKSNIDHINKELVNPSCSEAITQIIKMFKQNFLNTLDYEFGMSSVNAFDVMVSKFDNDLDNINSQCVKLQNETDILNKELVNANSNIEELKCRLAEKESAYNLLKAQKDKIVEISSAVTMDIVRREQEMHQSLSECCQKLLQVKLLKSDVDLSDTSNANIQLIIDGVIDQFKIGNYLDKAAENDSLKREIKATKNALYEKEKEVTELKTQVQSLRDVNNNVAIDLNNKENKLQTLQTAHDDLTKVYDSAVQENIKTIQMINELTQEIAGLKEAITNKELIISSLSEKDAETTELLKSLKDLQAHNQTLKSVNQMILNEKESYSIDLEKSSKTIKQNNLDIERMTSDILVLRESVKEAATVIESLKQKVQSLLAENAELKQNFDEKRQECSRLEINIKTHEKTAEIQSKMIMRLKKQKEEDDIVIEEKQTKISEVTEKYNSLQNECEELKMAKDSLEARVAGLEDGVEKPRRSLDGIPDSSRRRRQSIHDSRRLLEDLDEQRNLEAVFESRQKPDDLFMDVDDDSGRSTPFGLGRGRDSLLSRTDQSDKDEDHPSRPSSVLASRRRRQSIHDMHRGVPQLTPSPHDLSSRIIEELNNKNDPGEVSQIKEQLISCQQELEDLKERYKELDEECETCAEYLRERDEQCVRLYKEKVALEKMVAELKLNANSQSKPSGTDVAVNTDKDWANLHAVVVDRMSYDAEVEKNKRLTKCVEELRFQKQDLKNTIGKMQKALEKHSSKDTKELEATKKELKSVRDELEELKVRYKELDEECETCAEYLKEREEQCRKLKEAKAALESKLEELQEDAHLLAHSHSVRKKRQTIYDMNRDSVVDQSDAATETADDLPSHQAGSTGSSRQQMEDTQREIKRLKMIIEKLTHQKAALEQQLRTIQAPAPMYVATGSAIVQNQQLTDVMKENQKLKKINAKLLNICKKRSKSDANRENEDPCEQS